MKNLFLRTLAPIFAAASIFTTAVGQIPVPSEDGIVTFNPLVKIAQGNQPFSDTYNLRISMPANQPGGVSVPITLTLTSLSRPTGVSEAVAKSYVTVPSTVNMTAPFVNVPISIAVPLGSAAGGYSWKISTSGWPPANGNVVDEGGGHTINGLFTAPPVVDTSVPAVILNSPANGTIYTYLPLSGNPVVVPINFDASVPLTARPITGLSATINNVAVTLVQTGLNTNAANGVGSVSLTQPGSYTIRASASNQYGTSTATADITVVVIAPPPTIAVTSPAPNAQYSVTVGGPGVTVPVNFSATSVYGNVSSLAATLNGSPLTLTTSGVGTALTATGSASLNISTPGNYTLVFNATNAYGAATPVTVPFKVVGVTPPPTVTILTPANGAVFQRAAGAPPTVVTYTFSAGTSTGVISSVTATLDGVAITPTLSGLNTATVGGSGSFSFSSGGPHTLNVTVSNGGATASASTNFSVTQSAPPVCKDIEWLPPISLNKTIEGGSTMPIKFTLTCKGKFVEDKSVVIGIYEIYSNGTASAPTLYPYGTGSPNPPDYAITGKQYHLNFDTAKGVHQYRIEVYSTEAGAPWLIGSKDLFTSGKTASKTTGGDDDDKDSDKDKDKDKGKDDDKDKGKDSDKDKGKSDDKSGGKDKDDDKDKDKDKGKGGGG